MYDLRINRPKTWEELRAGNIAVTKNDIPFISIGADHACEHLNKLMKMRAGLVGISNNARRAVYIRRYYSSGCLPVVWQQRYSQYKNKYNNCTDDVAVGTIRFYFKNLK